MTSTDELVRERHGAVLSARINRPDSRNALNAAVMGGIGAAVLEAESDPEIRAIVLTGTGDRAFCAGMDLAAFASGDKLGSDSPEMRAFQRFSKGEIAIPVVGAANGTAVGGGLELLLGCDVIVASAAAKFGLPEVKRGLFPGGGGTFLGTRIPLAVALELDPDRRPDRRRPRQPARLGQHRRPGSGRAAHRARARRADRGQRAPGTGGVQGARPARRHRRRPRHRASGALVFGRVLQRRRQGGRHRLHGEADAALAGQMTSVRAAVCPQHGDPDVVRLERIPAPTPAPGQVKIRVAAAAVNFPDVLLVANKYQVSVPAPFVPGSEFAGVVTEIADGVADFAVGDRVTGTGMHGAFAEEIVADAGRLTAVPAGVALPQAAAFGVAHRTAYHALRSVARLRAGDDIVVLGAGGGVGLAAVQLAVELGATVTAAASSADKLDAAASTARRT